MEFLKNQTDVGHSEITLFSVVPWHLSSAIYTRKSVINFFFFLRQKDLSKSGSIKCLPSYILLKVNNSRQSLKKKWKQ